MKAASRRESNESVVAMKKRGLNVTPVTEEIEAAWRKMAESAYPLVKEKVVPPDIFDRALALVAEYRAKQAGAVAK
jgi:hypothetical protein